MKKIYDLKLEEKMSQMDQLSREQQDKVMGGNDENDMGSIRYGTTTLPDPPDPPTVVIPYKTSTNPPPNTINPGSIARKF